MPYIISEEESFTTQQYSLFYLNSAGILSKGEGKRS